MVLLVNRMAAFFSKTNNESFEPLFYEKLGIYQVYDAAAGETYEVSTDQTDVKLIQR